jgi:PAS domain S-box-containing protein
MASTAARAYLCVGLGAIVLYFVRDGDIYVYQGVGFLSAAVILGATAYWRPPTWRAWLAIGVSQALMSTGDLVYDFMTDRTPGPSDVFYLLGVAVLIAGVVVLVAATERRELVSHLDALLITIGVGIAAWTLAFNGVGVEGTIAARFVSVAYPVADLLLLGVLIRLTLTHGRRQPAYWLLLAGVISLFVSDGAWIVPAIERTYGLSVSWPDGGWMLSYILIAVAALSSSQGGLFLSEPGAVKQPLSLRRVLGVGTALVLAPTSVIVAELWHHQVDIVVVCSACAVLLALVVVRFAWIVRELDQLREQAVESERKFRMVFERAPLGISIGRDGMMQETNPALQEMLGYTGDEFARMHYTDVTHADDQDLLVQHELDTHVRQAFSVDKRYVRKDRSEIDAHVHVALDFESGVGISLIEDVTAHRRLEAQFRQSQKMEAIGKLAGGIAHDFNNLMTAVIGYSDLLLRQLGGEENATEKVVAIRESAVRATDLTRQLLAFGRRQTLQTTDVDLRDVVTRMDSLLRRLIGEDIKLETIFGAEEVVVRADRTQLEQVVVNLVVNARDAMPDGGTLTLAVVSNGETANLSVIDGGTGMSEETQERIFEPFFTTKELGEGSGLGLSTVHGIVGQSGGSVHVHSELGVGTAFTVRFPLVEALVLPAEPEPATLVD